MAVKIGGKAPGQRKHGPLPAMIGMMVRMSPPSKGATKAPDMPMGGKDTPMGGNLSKQNNAEETPGEEQAYHEQGKAPAPTPESVLYHDGSAVCAQCEYFNSGNCDFLQMAVDGGGHCQRFEAKSEDENSEHAMTGPDSEGSGDTDAFGGQ